MHEVSVNFKNGYSKTYKVKSKKEIKSLNLSFGVVIRLIDSDSNMAIYFDESILETIKSDIFSYPKI